MRISFALAICVSLAPRVFAQGTAVVSGTQQEDAVSRWSAAYNAGIAASRQHKDEEAIELFRRGWDTSDNDEERGLSADGLGQTERRLGHLKEARQWLERARQAFSKDPKFGLRMAVVISSLADLDRTTGDYMDAERTLRSALDSELCDAESRGLLRNYLADLLREQGKDSEAEQMFRDTLNAHDIRPRLRAGAFIGLADISRQRAAWDASVSYWNSALEIARGDHDEATEAVALQGLGHTWLQSGSAARAEPLLRRSLRIMEANSELPTEELAAVHSSLAELYRSENKLALAEDEWSRALDIDRNVLGNAHPQVAVLMEMLSDVYSLRGEFAMARDYSARASEAMSRSFGEDSMPAAAALSNQAIVEQRASDFDSAARHFERAIHIARSHPEHRPILAGMMERYAGLLRALHRSREAKALLAERNAWKESQNTPFPVK